MESQLPLSALLSQVLVAFTIEFDNEFEHQVPHRTTNYGSTAGSRTVPWLVSMTMWLMLLRFVPDDGIAASELKRMTGLPLKRFRIWLTRMSKWWGYVAVSGHVVRPTAGGLKASAVWRSLTTTIEGRWNKRFGKSRMDELREALQAPVRTLCQGYPDYLPVLGYELLSETPACESSEAPVAAFTLPMLLAKVLLAFAMEFESSSGRSLAVCANALRLIGKDGVRVRDLPRLAGVSKEATEMLAGRIDESGLGTVQPESSGGRVRLLTLMPLGERVRDAYGPLAQKIEDDWKARLGGAQIERLRELLEGLVGVPSGAGSPPLFAGLEPYPEGWRASVARIEQLPHFPMVLHRGGFPDGS